MLPRRHATASAGWLAAGLTGLFIACGTTSAEPAAAGGKAGSSTGATHSGATASGGSVLSPAGEGAGATANAGAGVGTSGNPSAGSTAAAGEAGMGSSVGGAGSDVPPGGPECEGDDQCTVVNDCCTCGVAPIESAPAECEKVCIQSACNARGIQAKAVCRSKRCVFDLSCDRSSVTCKAAEPECEAGQVPSVIDSCWGPCIDVGQCREVTDCAACTAGQVCVENQDSPALFTQCVAVDAACAESPTCACTDPCNFSCDDTDGIACFCINC